ncbi:hypothetical protein [Macrococcoides caseolyticum]|uniref:hypothetical protein n=1 Tax=Macrococcoides caseolyticum TaxID=69966 RepID=UPI000C5EC9A2|nr:hypothetical protein [Macrococcus caseolyticus]
MIKAGDKVTFDGDDYVIHNMEESGVTLYKDGNPLRPNFMGNVVFYSELAREQKQRADELENHVKNLEMDSYLSRERADIYKNKVSELEKRWSELVDVLKKKYEYYKVRADDESFGPIEQGKWKIAKHELMMVLKIMTDLKRGETE